MIFDIFINCNWVEPWWQ